MSTARSSAADCNSLSGLISSVSRRIWATISWAAGGLSQNPGAAIWSLIAAARACLPGRSKRVLQMLDPRDQILAFFAQLMIHRTLSRQFLQYEVFPHPPNYSGRGPWRLLPTPRIGK